MQIQILVNGRLYTEATYTEEEWKEEGAYRPTAGMASAFYNIRHDVMANTRWLYGRAELPRLPRSAPGVGLVAMNEPTVREPQPSGMTYKTAAQIEAHLHALVQLAGIYVSESCPTDRPEGIMSEHAARLEAIQEPFLE